MQKVTERTAKRKLERLAMNLQEVGCVTRFNGTFLIVAGDDKEGKYNRVYYQGKMQITSKKRWDDFYRPFSVESKGFSTCFNVPIPTDWKLKESRDYFELFGRYYICSPVSGSGFGAKAEIRFCL